MRIGYFIEKFPYLSSNPPNYRYSGGGVVALNLAIAMAHRGKNVSVFTTSADSKYLVEEYGNITIYRYSSKFQVFDRKISVNMIFKPLMLDLDIVHIHVTSSPIDVSSGLLYAKTKNKPLIITYHGDVYATTFSRLDYRLAVYFYNRLVDKLLMQANVIISPSKYYVEESKLQKYRDKVVVIPNGITIEKFDIPYSKEACRRKLGLPLDKKIILFVGILYPHKGPDVLLRAMPKILKEVPNAMLIFVGRGVLREKLEKVCKQLDIEEHVKFAGFVEESLKPFYYKSADVFCLPSVVGTEVFPVVLLEASAAGLPMVVSNLNTFKCIIEDGYNGLFTKRGDEKSLADAIIYLLENEEVRKEMGRNAREKVENYSWERIAEMTEKVYEQVISY